MNNNGTSGSGSPSGIGSPMPVVSDTPDMDEMFPSIRDLVFNYMKPAHLKDGPPEVGYELVLHVVHNMAKDLANDIYKQKTKMIREHKSRKAMASFYTKRVKKLETDNLTLKLALDSSEPGKKDVADKLQVPLDEYEENEHMHHMSQKFLLRKDRYNCLSDDNDKNKDGTGDTPLF